jgi:hypothetical protein
MRRILIFTLSLIISCILNAQGKATLSGRVTDFNGNPIDSVSVRLKNKQFKNVYETLSDINGRFSLQVEKGNYYCLYAIKLSDYGRTKLEYWTWNVPIFEDIEINPQYNNMEIYGINVIEPQVGPYETYMIYFRPMSLGKFIKILENQKLEKKSYETVEKVERFLKPSEDNLYDIAPNNITSDELSVKINGIESKVISIQKIKEYGRGIFSYGFLVQVLKPDEIKTMNLIYDKISIVLKSRETNEIGLGEAFFKRVE